MNNKLQVDFFKSELKKINDLFIKQDYEKVASKTKNIIKKFPLKLQPYNILGLTYRKQNKIKKAEEILLKALEINSNNYIIITNLGSIYRYLKKFIKSEKMYLKALKIKPDYTPALENYANLKRDVNEIDESIELYEKAYKVNDGTESVLLNLSATYQIVGKFDLSKKFLKILIKKFPKNTIADKMLSDLVDYSIDHNHQKEMLKKINDKNLNNKEKIPLYFGISKSFNDQKNYKKAYDFLKKGNIEKKKTFVSNDIDFKIKYLKGIIDLFDNYKFKKETKVKKNNFIFIIGLPRSGTTLLHQIIASHSKVYGGGELTILDDYFSGKVFNKDFINKIFVKNDKKDYLNKISKEIISEFKDISKDKIIIDKMPSNFFWIGFIKIFLPNSKIIHVTRNLKDNCLSIYKNLFDRDALGWTYNENDILQYVKFYNELMNLWKKKLPNFIYEFKYEKLISNQVEETRKVINFCNLNLEMNCIDYLKTQSSVKTASIIQVRKPIYKTSINQSLEYVKYLDFLNKLEN